MKEIIKLDDNSNKYLYLKCLRIKLVNSLNKIYIPHIGVYGIFSLKLQLTDKDDDIIIYFDTMGRFNNDKVPTLILPFKNSVLMLKCYNLENNLNNCDKISCYLYPIFMKFLDYYNNLLNSKLKGIQILLYKNIENSDADFKIISVKNGKVEFEEIYDAVEFFERFNKEKNKSYDEIFYGDVF